MHQFVRIGAHAMIGGMTGVDHDVIPYGSVLGERGRLAGLNMVGLKRRGFNREQLHNLRAAYRTLFEESGAGTVVERVELVIEKFGDEIAYEADSGNLSKDRELEWDFFSVGVRRDPILGYKRFLSEDWYFCQRWREIGGKVVMLTTIQCHHIGTFKYPAQPRDIYEAADVYRTAEKQAQELKAKLEEIRSKEAAA